MENKTKIKIILITIILGIMILTLIFGLNLINLNPSQTNSEQNMNWQETITLLNTGEVESIMQAHNLDISLILKNGTIIHTKESRIDEIFDEIEKCGNVCKNIVMATE